MKTNTHASVEDMSISILVDGQLTRFDYEDLKLFHKGDSWFGCTLGFRVMQIAARELCNWSRENLSVLCGHPGPGVKDAIELITATVSSNNFQLHESVNTQGGKPICNSSMMFEWWLTANNKTVHIKLHDDIVPASFLQLLDRLNADNYLSKSEKSNDKKQFKQMKQDLSKLLWEQSLDASFDINHVTTPTSSGANKQC